jgi:hypothetical protein
MFVSHNSGRGILVRYDRLLPLTRSISTAKLVVLSDYGRGPRLIIWVSCANRNDPRYSSKPPKMRIAKRTLLKSLQQKCLTLESTKKNEGSSQRLPSSSSLMALPQ